MEGNTSTSRKRILFLDAYDSYTNNIVALLKQVLGDTIQVHVRHIDLLPVAPDTETWTTQDLIDNLKFYDAVVCGPGPGSPLKPEDVGAFETLWNLPPDAEIPVLGICLGFQSLVCNFGGAIRRLKRGLHGMVREIDFQDSDIFSGIKPFKATLYHSLCADIGQDDISDSDWPRVRYGLDYPIKDLMPLAWSRGLVDEGEDDRILMAVRHVTKPFWGLQYHPESVCTEPNAHGVLINWWAEACKWNRQTNRISISTADQTSTTTGQSKVSHVDRFDQLVASEVDSQAILQQFPFSSIGQIYSFEQLSLPADVSVADLVEILGQGGTDAVVLDSSSASKGDPLAQYSIIAIDAEREAKIMHRAGDTFITISEPLENPNEPAQSRQVSYPKGTASDDEFDAWQLISKFWEEWRLRFSPPPVDAPPVFKGGLMGYITYESGLSSLTPVTVPKERGHSRPDICLVCVTKSVVIDHAAGLIYIQKLSETASDGQKWCRDTTDELTASFCLRDNLKSSSNTAAATTQNIQTSRKRSSRGDTLNFSPPKAEDYKNKVRQCQEAIREGNSYELCLTGKTVITKPKRPELPKRLRANPNSWRATASHIDMHAWKADQADATNPWNIYKMLRSRQPAPFASFIRLGGVTLLSASPERFLKYTPEGVCSMRPMKGTVRKSKHVSTLKQAEEILHIPKEEAENLMIVDLVRHDLHGICGSGRVIVPELLKVEEYATVFQMVTNVQGHLSREQQQQQSQTSPERSSTPLNGLDVLSSVLPPGSMTGAPKKRSCEILHKLEGGVERSLYSGVVGYMDITGRGDWSVTIRSVFMWDDEVTLPEKGERQGKEKWHIGAGGAVTILSTPEGEYDEMVTKLQGPLNVFREID